MELTPEQQKAIEQQKAQCIFCQIIEGKVPSKKVYEDARLLGILDINPASGGHVLLMPKEHYPIMPLIPPDTFKHMFSKLKDIDQCVKQALLCKETTVLIANGAAAGQQSTHFMLHIIPREGGDGLDMLDLKGKEAPEEETKEVMEKTAPALKAILGRNLPALGYTEATGDAGGEPEVPQDLTKEQLLQIIDSNPQLKDIITQKPDQFKQLVPRHPQLSQIFKKFDLDDIIKEVTGKEPDMPDSKVQDPEKKEKEGKKPGKLSLDGALK